MKQKAAKTTCVSNQKLCGNFKNVCQFQHTCMSFYHLLQKEILYYQSVYDDHSRIQFTNNAFEKHMYSISILGLLCTVQNLLCSMPYYIIGSYFYLWFQHYDLRPKHFVDK